MKYKTAGGIELEGTPQEIAEYFYEKHRIEKKEIKHEASPIQVVAFSPEKEQTAQVKNEKLSRLAKYRWKIRKAELEVKREKKREYQRRWCAKKREMEKHVPSRKAKSILGMSLAAYIASKENLDDIQAIHDELEAKGVKIKKKNLWAYVKTELRRREKRAERVASTPETAQKNEVLNAITSVFGGQ